MKVSSEEQKRPKGDSCYRSELTEKLDTFLPDEMKKWNFFKSYIQVSDGTNYIRIPGRTIGALFFDGDGIVISGIVLNSDSSQHFTKNINDIVKAIIEEFKDKKMEWIKCWG